MKEVYEEVKLEILHRKECLERLKKTLDRLYRYWANELVKKNIAELNILEKLNEITDDAKLKIDILDNFTKFMRSKGIKCLMLERTLAGRYLKQADQNLLSINLYKIDYMHNLFHRLGDQKKIEELNKVYKKFSKLLTEAWGIQRN